LIELESKQTIWPAQFAAGFGRVAVGFQNLAHVVFAGGWSFIHGRPLCLADRAVWSIDAYRMAVMGDAAKQCIDHAQVAEEVARFVITQVLMRSPFSCGAIDRRRRATPIQLNRIAHAAVSKLSIIMTS